MTPRTFLGILFFSLATSRAADCQWTRYYYGYSPGMYSSMITSALEDENKTLWFGTDLGLYHFIPENVSNWVLYNETNGLAGRLVSGVYKDRDGILWIATDNGISRYSGNKFTNFRNVDGLESNIVRAITQSPDGTLYFGTFNGGISSYTPSSGFRHLPLPARDSCILSLLALSDSVLLAGTFPGGLIIYRNDSTYTLSNPADLEGKIIYSLYSSNSGEVWVGTDKGAQQYDIFENRILPVADSLKGRSVFSISQNDSGRLVFGSQNKIYQFGNGRWSSLAPWLSRPTSFNALLYDSDGSLWAGSSSQGLFIYHGGSWMGSGSTALTESVYSVCEDPNQNIWFGSYEDVYRFDGIFWKKVTGPELIPDDYWYHFRQLAFNKNGFLWGLKSSYYLYNFNGQTWNYYASKDYFGGAAINNLISDPAGNIWITTDGYGIYRFDGESWKEFTSSDGLESNFIGIIGFYPNGNLVAVSYHGSLSYYDGSVWSKANVLPYNMEYYNMVIDTGNNIWIASNQGLVKIKDNMIEETYFNGNGVQDVKIDKEGKICVLYGNNRLSRYDGINWQTYTPPDDLPEAYLIDLFIDSRGRTWLLADNGVYKSDKVTGSRDIKPEGNGIQAKPNPFSDVLNLQYYSDKPGDAVIRFITQDGRVICQFTERFQRGNNLLQYNTEDWPVGLVICSITISGTLSREKLVKISNTGKQF